MKIVFGKNFEFFALYLPLNPESQGDEKSNIGDDDIDEPEKPKTVLGVLWQGFVNFFVETSVHGFKYIVEDDAALWEKLFWTVTLCLSLTIAGYSFSISKTVYMIRSLESFYRYSYLSKRACAFGHLESIRPYFGLSKTANDQKYAFEFWRFQ